MNIKDGIKYASELLSMSEVAAGLAGSGTGAGLAPAAARELADLLSCAHGVVREVAADHARAIYTEYLWSSLGIIRYSSFSRSVVEVLSVVYYDAVLNFTEVPEGIKTGVQASCSVTYSYLPLIAALTDTVEFDNPKIDARVLGFGIAAEYCMRQGMSDEAVLWDRRYKDALVAAKRKKRERKIPARRWV